MKVSRVPAHIIEKKLSVILGFTYKNQCMFAGYALHTTARFCLQYVILQTSVKASDQIRKQDCMHGYWQQEECLQSFIYTA